MGKSILFSTLIVLSIFMLGCTSQQPDTGGSSIVSINAEDLIGNSTILGSPNATVTIVEFSDFECPYCQRFYKETMPSIKSKYVDTGKVKIVFKHFPLESHKFAIDAAQAAECAKEQGRFWDMHDKLYENGVDGGSSQYKQYAKDLGLESTQFDECIDSDRKNPIIEEDARIGESIGVEGTPTFIVDDEIIVGAQPLSVFERIIDSKLAE